MYNKFSWSFDSSLRRYQIVNTHYNVLYEIICNQYITVGEDRPRLQIYFDTKIKEEENFKNIVI